MAVLSFRCSRSKEALLRLTAENLALTSFDLFRIEPTNTRTFLGADPDIDGSAAFLIQPPGPGEPAAQTLVVLVKPATLGQGGIPIRLRVEQDGAPAEPLQPPQVDPDDYGYLLGEAQSGGFAEFRFGLFFLGGAV